jgi:hypothetical protein
MNLDELENRARASIDQKRAKTPPARAGFKVGDSVVVKPGVSNPDFGIEIGEWQGWISALGVGQEDMIMIAWDSVTLRNMPDFMIQQSEEQGLSWAEMGLEPHEIELSSPRDTEADVVQVIDELSRKHAWSWLGEEGMRIGQILDGIDPDDETALLHRWEKHLKRHLRFPFEAEVAEYQERGPLKSGNRVTVRKIFDVDDFYGVIILLTHRRRQYHFPLCDLEVVDENSPNYEPVSDYAVWFANR